MTLNPSQRYEIANSKLVAKLFAYKCFLKIIIG